MMRTAAALGLMAVMGLVRFVGLASADPSENSSMPPAVPSAAPAATAPPGSAVPSATAATTDDHNKIICRNRVATGSRLAYTRDCHTQREWDAITQTGRDYINGQQMKGLESGKPGG
ncbi:MAG: hypothetical protein ACJ8EL_03050 [Rhizomicrobium sp.]|jgi:hypothetical protein